jgi:hypothetical protein
MRKEVGMSKIRVGDIRPSQFMYTYGIGSIIDLPAFSVIVSGLDDWKINPDTVTPIFEDRLLKAVQYYEPQTKSLISPPLKPDDYNFGDPFDERSTVGLPVRVFPSWMVCPKCHLLAPIETGLFELKKNFYRVENNRFVHTGCTKKGPSGKAPQVVPARFLAACEDGHLDDFPWSEYVHQGQPCTAPILKFNEFGMSGEARGVIVECMNCGSKRPLSEAFRKEKRDKLPLCAGSRPHLRDTDPKKCEYHIRPIVLGASNSWFSVIQSVIAIPVEGSRLNQLVDEHWGALINVESAEILDYLRKSGSLSNELSDFPDEKIMQAIKEKHAQSGDGQPGDQQPDLKRPEWDVFTGKAKSANNKEFRFKKVDVPGKLEKYISKILLVERLREVSALIGFTRIDSFGEYVDPDLEVEIPRVPLYRKQGDYMPANEIRGEGIFLQIDEDMLNRWESKNPIQRREMEFFESHKKWKEAHFIENPEDGFPGIRYVLLHTLSHALMRQLSLECGYPSASIRERIYCASDDPKGPMAGILLYTAAPDSDGTLGGLVEMGKTDNFELIMSRLFEDQSLCANDPTCAENIPNKTGQTIHGAACHACMFAPETSCERGNKYLDRSLISATIEFDDLVFFE